MRSSRIVVFSLLGALWFQPLACAKDYLLFYLGGQSNMDGFGKVSELPAPLKEPMKGVMIFHGNPAPDNQVADGRGLWSELRPGHGFGFQSDGQQNQYSELFGVELSFAQKLRELYPDSNIALIKYSRGGTSIDMGATGMFGCWDPDYRAGEGVGQGINQYDHFLATLRHALAARDIDGDGSEDRLIPTGVLWMQGESDAAYTEEIARRYEGHLKRLMDLIRAALRTDDVPVAIGRISDSGKGEGGKVWRHGEIVRQAQADFVAKDGHAALVESTDGYGYSDPYHYDSPGYVDLGQRFAESLSKLRKP